MFNWLSHRLSLYKLNRRENKLNSEWERQSKKANEQGSPDLVDEWYDSVGHYDYEEIDWERKTLVSRNLISEADKLHLPRPKTSERQKWDGNSPPHVPYTYVLTPAAMTEVRATIRKEKRERRETVEWWVKIAGGLITIGTGLVGALIGLVAVWKHKP